MPSNRAPRLLSGVIVVVVALSMLSTGCGSDDTASTATTSPTASAKAAVCTSLTDVSSAFDTVISDVREANFGKASKSIADLASALTGLGKSVSKLGSAEREKIQPQLDDVTDDAKALTTGGGSGDLTASAEKLQTDLDAAAAAVDKDLDCPN